MKHENLPYETFKMVFKGFDENKQYTVRLVRRSYRNGTLAVEVQNLDKTEDPPMWEPWSVATVNLDPYTGLGEQSGTLAYFDSNDNSGTDLEAVLVREGIIKPTGRSARSGYCTYPLYEWDVTRLMQM